MENLWDVVFPSEGAVSVREKMEHTSFDELMVINLGTGICTSVYHMEGKYYAFHDGDLDTIRRYASAQMIHPEDRRRFSHFMYPGDMRERLRKAGMPGMLQGEFRHRTLSDKWIWTRFVLASGVENGYPEDEVYLYIYDTEAMHNRLSGKQPEDRDTSVEAARDALTDLYTEDVFFAMAEDRLESIEGRWCIVDVDIEHYKLFTDWHGLATGRRLLSRFGAILDRTAVRMGGLAGYRGQDDFCLMIPFDREAIDGMYGELKDAIRAVSSTVGFLPLIGICMLDPERDHVMEAYNRAALTTEELKGNLQQRIAVYDPGRHEKNMEEYRILLDYQNAFHSDRIFFELQPQCLVQDGRVIGAEALARWRRQDGTYVSPAVFVPVLEKYGIVTNLDQYIWEKVFRWIRQVRDRGIHTVPVSLNISQVDLRTIDVPEHFRMLLEKYQLPTEAVKLEITESAFIRNMDTVKDAVRRLREMGFLVMMDDFGSGYSSLNMLRDLNMDVIKIDAQFLKISEQNERKGVSILESIVNMTRILGLPVIVEGVENEHQAVFLRGLGCQYMQGYLYYRPMPAEQFENLIADEEMVDHRGIRFSANQQLHTREFMDENVYSDVMLNNILGPVAFYNWHDDHVDIVRYNKQFYEMVGIEPDDFDGRLQGIEQYFLPADRSAFLNILRGAMEDHINGARGVVRVYRPSGVLVWLSLQVFFIGENEKGKKFYASAEDVSEVQYINSDLPAGYFRTDLDQDFEFQFISQKFCDMVGFSREEIRTRFDNRLMNLVYRKDRATLAVQAEEKRRGEREHLDPYRLVRKSGSPIWVAEQSVLTDLYGKTCWQSAVIDISEVVELRNQMRLITRYSSSTIIFLVDNEKGYHFDVVGHGMESRLGIGREAFTRALNDGTFYSWIQTEKGRIADNFFIPNEGKNSAEDVAKALRYHFRRHTENFDYRCRIRLPDGHVEPIRIRADKVLDAQRSTQFIIVISTQ